MKENKALLSGIIFFIFLTSTLIINSQENINEPRWITADAGLNMRDAPNLNAKKIGLIPYGEQVLLIEETGNPITISGATGKWSKIKWKGKMGWVFGAYLARRAVGIPSAGQILPLPAGVAAGKDSTVYFYSTKGKLLASRSVTGISWMDRDQIVLAGSLSLGANSLPLVYYSLKNKGTLKLNINNTITDLTSLPDLISISGAEGTSCLAVVTLDMTSGSPDAMRLYVVNMHELPGMSPRINWGTLPEPKHGNVIQPLAVYYVAGRARGLWFAYSVEGIGGYWPVLQGLLYLDFNNNKVTKVIDPGLRLGGISPDQTLVAFNPDKDSGYLFTNGFSIRNILTGKELSFSLHAKSNLGAGFMVFSPDNRLVAWMEAGGPSSFYADGEEPEFRLRVAHMDGTHIVNTPAADLSSCLGVEAILSATPVGWISNQLLLLEVYSETQNRTVLVVWAPDPAQPLHQALVIAEGKFLGFIYP
jgi:hypothetical protein